MNIEDFENYIREISMDISVKKEYENKKSKQGDNNGTKN